MGGNASPLLACARYKFNIPEWLGSLPAADRFHLYGEEEISSRGYDWSQEELSMRRLILLTLALLVLATSVSAAGGWVLWMQGGDSP